ncbi:tRNA pseudouridine(38-40) synthase TruA [Enterococcus nangangensis]|uniref:tRNA pseudouridine(38-40) synthase TruA n=1 Tax=Enterococcus nangangensis TaxID=2559926 RepID=UPI001FE89F64|nr:tRNA pseudouridine(38-40) synthase TruA [Enterococcus nangangensis]
MRYRAIIAYDGTNFHGFQTQPVGRTVEEELTKTLTKINSGQPVAVFGSGRTDAKVHARGQVIHFDLPQVRPLEKIRFALDTQTPDDIACLKVEEVAEDFHARYHVVQKTYEFRVDTAKARNPFKRHYASYFPYPVDLTKMRVALEALCGTHDFTSFCASGSTVEDKVRTIHQATVEYLPQEEELLFTFTGDGFLYKMVRIIVGTVLKMGNERLDYQLIPEILAGRDRNLAGPTAHPEGLYLVKVEYE